VWQVPLGIVWFSISDIRSDGETGGNGSSVAACLRFMQRIATRDVPVSETPALDGLQTYLDGLTNF
jgi:hypothetical protein